MSGRFEKIDPEQQERILNASIEEFASQGYAKASTNAIVKRAGIPKGTLFYFFGSKKGLYLYILDRAVSSYVEISKQQDGELPSDLFERLMYLHRSRMHFALSQPLMFRLFYDAFINTADEIREELENRYQEYASGGKGLISRGIDRSTVRPGVDVNKAIDMITLMLEGLLNRHMSELKMTSPESSLAMVEKISRECEDYFEMIRKGIYLPQQATTRNGE